MLFSKKVASVCGHGCGGRSHGRSVDPPRSVGGDLAPLPVAADGPREWNIHVEHVEEPVETRRVLAAVLPQREREAPLVRVAATLLVDDRGAELAPDRVAHRLDLRGREVADVVDDHDVDGGVAAGPPGVADDDEELDLLLGERRPSTGRVVVVAKHPKVYALVGAQGQPVRDLRRMDLLDVDGHGGLLRWGVRLCRTPSKAGQAVGSTLVGGVQREAKDNLS